MKYKFKIIQGVTQADTAYEVQGNSLNELFEQSAYALTNEQADLKTISKTKQKIIKIEQDTIERALFDFLSELVFLKDKDNFIPSLAKCEVKQNKKIKLKAILKGETINPKKHKLKVDVKAITYHLFKIEKTNKGYKAIFILDV